MKLWVRMFSISAVFVIIVLGTGFLSINQFNKISSTLEEDIPRSIESIEEASQLDELAKFIRYYDEVLTQSARNYAFTQDKKWEERYNNVVPLLDSAIQNAIEKGDEIEKSYFSNVNDANIALVDMEVQSFELVNEGNHTAAIAILESTEYWVQKAIYENGLRNYIEHVGGEYDEVLVASTQTTHAAIEQAKTLVTKSRAILIGGFILTFLASVFLLVFMVLRVSNPITKLSKVATEIGKGNFTKPPATYTKDEIGALYKEIVDMSDKIKNARTLLERKVIERTKQLEESNKHLKDLDRAKTDFLNVTSHELKTPLTVIYAYLDILDDSKKLFNKEQKKNLKVIRRNTDQLKGIITNILESARIDAGKFELVYEDIKPKETIQNIVDDLSKIGENENLKLKTVFSEDLPEKMTTDAQRFNEIFNNLLSNAIKFTKKGTITVNAKKQGENLEVTVTDTGEGIPKDKLKHLFEEFYQVDSSISRKYGGTGLGLSITKKIIELQGGTINVTSKVGIGTTFTFTLPLTKKESVTLQTKREQ